LDLVKRKLIADQGKTLTALLALMGEYVRENAGAKSLQGFVEPFKKALASLEKVSRHILKSAVQDPNEMGAAATDYLKLFGLVMVAYMWACMAKVAEAKLGKAEHPDFYQAKLHTARFYFQRVLPQVEALERIILAGSEVLMALEEEGF
jgi:acyl-CoA dehydrogenase